MLRTKTTIGEVAVTRNGSVARRSAIEAHPTYGVTCGELGTTNGNLTEVAKRIDSLVRAVPEMRLELEDESYDIEVKIGVVRISPLDVGADGVFSLLNDLYKRTKHPAKSPAL
jgi:hypothetical protein